jgi:hypothetical protein
MPNKLYKTPEDAQAIVAEPVATYPAKVTVSRPCHITVDELKAEVLQSVEDAGNGLGITIEQARKRHPLT